MVSKDIPLDGGWIIIHCNSGGEVGTPGCIFIHKVRAGCSGGNPIADHMNLVSLNMNEGRGSLDQTKSTLFHSEKYCKLQIYIFR